MGTTITHATGTITPTALEGYKASRDARNLILDVLDRAAPDITLRAFGLRTGTLTIVLTGTTSAATAFAAYGALSAPQTLTLTNTDIPALNMTFVIGDGSLDIEQDDDDTTIWRIDIPFQEVAP